MRTEPELTICCDGMIDGEPCGEVLHYALLEIRNGPRYSATDEDIEDFLLTWGWERVGDKDLCPKCRSEVS